LGYLFRIELNSKEGEMMMLSITGNEKGWELSSHLCQVRVENHHNGTSITGLKKKMDYLYHFKIASLVFGGIRNIEFSE
jgi:hypothetical protein